MNPREFFNAFVLPTIEEWRFDAMDIRRATFAICQLDILVERVTRHANPTFSDDNFRAERERLRGAEPMLGLVQDIHDSHKHGPLRPTKRKRAITKDQRPQVHSWGGAISSAPISAAPISGTIDELVIREDDGTRHDLRTVISRCLDHWTAELARLGL